MEKQQKRETIDCRKATYVKGFVFGAAEHIVRALDLAVA